LCGVNNELAELLATHGVVRRADTCPLTHAIEWARRTGEITSVLPGLYAATAASDDPRIRALAVCLADPDAIFFGATAAWLQDPSGRPPVVLDVASQRLRSRAWLRASKRRIPPELVVRTGLLALTAPTLTALDLAESTDGASIDHALRRGARLEALHSAFAMRPARRGRRAVRRLLHDSRDQPWSWAERRAHVELRRAGIVNWTANRPILSTTGRLIGYGDLVFDAAGVVVEIDGDQWHTRPADVLRDRARDRELTELGWVVARFRAAEVIDDPRSFLASIRTLLAAHGGRLRLVRRAA